MAANQAYLFFIFVITGVVISILFDVFRILRKSFKTPDLITYLEDILFWILTGCISLYTIFYFNNGEIRFFLFLGIGLGVVLYMITLSKYFIKVSVFIITIVKTIIQKLISIVLFPIRKLIQLIQKLLYKPIIFAFVNFRKFSTKNVKKLGNFMKKHKKIKNNPKKAVQK